MSHRVAPNGWLIAADSCWNCGTEDGIHLCGDGYACQAHCPVMAPDTYRESCGLDPMENPQDFLDDLEEPRYDEVERQPKGRHRR